MILFPEGRPVERETFAEYRRSGGYGAVVEPLRVLDAVAASGLRGRGGAGFPVAKKWLIAVETGVTPRYLVCNAGEDEPGSFKDRALLEHRPHLVLEGTLLAARAIGADQAYICINETYEDCISLMSAAVDEAQRAGCLPSLAVSIHRAPTVYVAGEDSAISRS